MLQRASPPLRRADPGLLRLQAMHVCVDGTDEDLEVKSVRLGGV